MPRSILVAPGGESRPVWVMAEDGVQALPGEIAAWLSATGASEREGEVHLVADGRGQVEAAVLSLGKSGDPFAAGALSRKLPEGRWRIANPGSADMGMLALGFLLGSYRYDRYRTSGEPKREVLLEVPDGVDAARVWRMAEGCFLVRDLVNTPANDMGPDQIEEAARRLVRNRKGTIRVIKGDDLLARNFPMIHAVGRASASAPRLIDIRWGRRSAPRVTLVGKGVAFDTGGLDIKPSSGMRNMKKDMGGAASVLGLAQMIMDAGLDVRLRVLVPAVENAISSNAFRPGDVYPTRKGLTVEIGNTDAEGRLVLADALALADEERPELLIDMATLTGAARVALGPEVVPFYTRDDALADLVASASAMEQDPVWRMPLWAPYERLLTSTVADCGNVTTDGFAGSVTAALFLGKFVQQAVSWMHFDIFAWNPSARPHAPAGGEAQAVRALYAVLEGRYPPSGRKGSV